MSHTSRSNGSDKSACFRQFEERVIEGDYIDALDAAADLVACIKGRISGVPGGGSRDSVPLLRERDFTRSYLTVNEASPRPSGLIPWMLPLALLLVVVLVALVPWAPVHW
jgi:hypothetical protein